jgi:hemerythrin
MGRLQWSNDLMVGHAGIDQQHKELFARMNALLDAMSTGRGKIEVIRLVEFLQGYVETHFRDEEKWMLRVNYPAYPAHKAQHTTFERKLAAAAVQAKAQGGSAALAIQMQNEVGDWLVNHIGQVDRKLAGFLGR